MNTESSIGRYLTEEFFYKAVLGLLAGLPVIELITEIIYRFDNKIHPLYFVPLVMDIFGGLATLVIIFYWFTVFPGKRRLRYSDIFYFTLIFFMVISIVFSLNPGVFSDGDLYYSENPLHFLVYYSLYFAGTLIDNEKYRKNIIFSFVFVAILEGIFGFLQTFDIELAYSVFYHVARTAYGLTQNSNFYAGMCVLFVACVSGMYIFADQILGSKKKEYALLVFAGFLFYTMMGSRARLAWVGFASLVVFYVLSLIIMYRKDEDKKVMKAAVRRSLILLGVYFVVLCIVFFFTDYIREIAVRSYWEVANGNVDKMGSDRIYNWRKGLENVPGHWLTGVGLDNYRYVFISSPDYVEGMYLQDKAHNEFLHILVTQGLPSLINYLALLIFAGAGAVKSILNETSVKKRAVTWILLGMLITYCFQSLFNSSIPYVVIYFWIAVGLITPRNVIKRNKNPLKS